MGCSDSKNDVANGTNTYNKQNNNPQTTEYNTDYDSHRDNFRMRRKSLNKGDRRDDDHTGMEVFQGIFLSLSKT
jgi:hypothetical protein